ncbi:MAG: hypothetical protein HQK85_12750 [Nitrospinae bacterium]|nr:hypothetical protein [Nitrospinota bacterium]
MAQGVCDLRDEGLWRFTGAFAPDKTLAGGGTPALLKKNGWMTPDAKHPVEP